MRGEIPNAGQSRCRKSSTSSLHPAGPVITASLPRALRSRTYSWATLMPRAHKPKMAAARRRKPGLAHQFSGLLQVGVGAGDSRRKNITSWCVSWQGQQPQLFLPPDTHMQQTTSICSSFPSVYQAYKAGPTGPGLCLRWSGVDGWEAGSQQMKPHYTCKSEQEINEHFQQCGTAPALSSCLTCLPCSHFLSQQFWQSH